MHAHTDYITYASSTVSQESQKHCSHLCLSSSLCLPLDFQCTFQSFLDFIAVEILTALDPMVRERDFRLGLKDLLCNCCRQRIVGDSAASLQNQCDGIASSSTSVGIAQRRNSQCTLLSTTAVPTDLPPTTASINTSADSLHEHSVNSV